MVVLLFIVLSIPQTYKITNLILPTFNKGPTHIGIIFHSIVLAVILIIAKKMKRDNFVDCKDGDYIMNSDIEKKYANLNEIMSPITNMGTRGCKWPYNKRYIPQTDRHWCLKKV